MSERHHKHQSSHIYHGTPQALRSAERVQEMEVDRAVTLTLDAFHCCEDQHMYTVVDIGTGTGLFAEALARKGLHVIGVDPNPAMLALAREYLPGASFREGTAEALPCSDGECDLAFMGMVFHEVDDRAQALREAARVARHGIAMLEWQPRNTPHGPSLEHRVKLEDLETLCASLGLGKPQMVELTYKVLFLINLDAVEETR